MPILLHRHLQLDTLAAAFAGVLGRRPAGMHPLAPEYLVVQTPGMRKWLALETARQSGSFARVECLTPVQFIMKLGFLVLRQREERSVFEKDVLPWALYRIIGEDVAAGLGELRPLADWLAAGGGAEDPAMRRFSLAATLADLFDQYMLSRGDLLAAWEGGGWLDPRYPDRPAPARPAAGQSFPEEVWQAHLWRRLMALGGDGSSRADFFDRLKEGLGQVRTDDADWLPERVFLFGMTLLPTRFLDIFNQLAKRIEVHLFLQVPSVHYYGDLVSDATLRRLERRNVDTGRLGLDGGNRLLANLGSTGREFMDQILETCHQEMDGSLDPFELGEWADVDGTPASLLAGIQADVRLCRPGRKEPQALDEAAWSLRVARCPGRLREVEVLKDLLLECFGADSALAPAEVLVVSTDPAAYGPLVELVFRSGPEERRLPYTLADCPGLQENRPLRLAADLLAAVGGRFSPAEIVPLFEEACELSGAPLEVLERQALAGWCRDSGIRWGRDGRSKAAFRLPEDDALTWAAGLDRLFAGYAVAGPERLDDGLWPAGGSSPGTALLLGRLAAFVHELGLLAEAAAIPRPLAGWMAIVRPALNRLLGAAQDDDRADQSRLAGLNACLQAMADRLELAGMAEAPLDWELFAGQLAAGLGETAGHGNFLAGAITVAGMVPMRSLPFKVIAVLGLDQGAFPRFVPRPEYDLMRHRRLPGDRDTLEADRYLFLEMLLSARNRLILLSGGQAEDGGPAPVSSVVELLLSWLDQEYTIGELPAGKAVTVKYPLQPYSARYLEKSDHGDTDKGTLPPKSTKNPEPAELEKAPAPLTFATEWFDPPPPRPEPAPLFDWRLAASRQSGSDGADAGAIDGARLLKALTDPLAWFLREGCRIRTGHEDPEELPANEAFALDALAEWQLRNAVCERFRGGEAHGEELLAASGVLPPGHAGHQAVIRERAKIDSRIESVRAAAGGQVDFGLVRVRSHAGNKLFVHEYEACLVYGAGGCPDSQILLDAGRFKAKRLLAVWLAHLFGNLVAPRRTSLYALDKTFRIRPIAQPDKAAARLADLADLAAEAATRPLPLFPDAAWLFSQEPDESKGLTKAWQSLQPALGRVWQPDPGQSRDDPWLIRAFTGADSLAEAGVEAEFIALARRVFGPVIEHEETQE
jgi:exodeoxyribonuclease V gamma subunit